MGVTPPPLALVTIYIEDVNDVEDVNDNHPSFNATSYRYS